MGNGRATEGGKNPKCKHKKDKLASYAWFGISKMWVLKWLCILLHFIRSYHKFLWFWLYFWVPSTSVNEAASSLFKNPENEKRFLWKLYCRLFQQASYRNFVIGGRLACNSSGLTVLKHGIEYSFPAIFSFSYSLPASINKKGGLWAILSSTKQPWLTAEQVLSVNWTK